MPMAAFARDGMFMGASDAARSLLGFRNLTEAGLDGARSDALKQGRSETPVGIGHMVLQRVGTGADIGLVALIAPSVTQATPVEKAHAHRESRARRAGRSARAGSGSDPIACTGSCAATGRAISGSADT